MSFLKAWNNAQIIRSKEAGFFAKKGQMLLGTKAICHKLPKEVWIDDNAFLRNAVSIPFRRDVRKPIRIILIGGSRIGKTTLVSCMVDDLQNDFHVPTLGIYPKGTDAVYHNKLGKGKKLCPSEDNRMLNNELYMPFYKKEDTPWEIQKDLMKFAFELYDFNPNTDPGFMEEDPKDYSKSVYVLLSILLNKNPILKKRDALFLYDHLDDYTYQSMKFFHPRKIYVPFGSLEALKNRLMSSIAKKFFYQSSVRIDKYKFIKDWNQGKSHAFMFFADANDPRVQSYTAKILQIAQDAKRKDNLMQKRRNKRERPLWLILDDARELVANHMDFERYRARREVERCIYMFGEDGWNTLMVYHNVEDIPKGLLKEADYIISSRLDRQDAALLPGDEFKMVVQRLFVKPFNYYNEWAVRSKDGTVRTFFAIDSRVGLK